MILCHNRLSTYKEVELAVAHELIHAYDFCRASNLDLTNCHHHACTEVSLRFESLDNMPCLLNWMWYVGRSRQDSAAYNNIAIQILTISIHLDLTDCLSMHALSTVGPAYTQGFRFCALSVLLDVDRSEMHLLEAPRGFRIVADSRWS